MTYQRRLCGDRGDAGPLEAVILMPVLLATFALVVVFGSAQGADNSVEHAAKAGARAAATAQTAGGGHQRAESAVDAALAESPCANHSIDVAGSWTPGGRVHVTVTCTADLSDVSGLVGVPGTRTMSASASEPVDSIRGG
jgi:Flp pilus assembly protein TadG